MIQSHLDLSCSLVPPGGHLFNGVQIPTGKILAPVPLGTLGHGQ